MKCQVLQVERADCRDGHCPDIMRISLIARIISLKYTLWQDWAGQLFEFVNTLVMV
jgi:hypothetical protein